MRIEIFEPKTRKEERYAVGVPTGGPVAIIQTYHSLEQLEAGYTDWRKYAENKRITKPIPLERVRGDTWKILKSMIPRRE